MIRYFYLVEFSYPTEEDSKSRFDLGVFSTRKKAEEKSKCPQAWWDLTNTALKTLQ